MPLRHFLLQDEQDIPHARSPSASKACFACLLRQEALHALCQALVYSPSQNFIADIRGAQNKEDEVRRIEKELAKIRSKFADDKSLSGSCTSKRRHCLLIPACICHGQQPCLLGLPSLCFLERVHVLLCGWPAGYDRRKYVWKLLYIYMLGYNIEFGHKQAADLILCPK